MTSWIVERSERLDSALARLQLLPSRAEAQRYVTDGLVTVNDAVVVKPSHTLHIGDVLGIRGKRIEEPSSIRTVNLSLPILYEDDACIVIDKPAGIAMHPGAGTKAIEDTLLSGIRHLFEERKIPFHESSVLVHRLDKETTGCLLIAKTSDTQRALQKQFADRTVEKQYLTIVAGIPSPAAAIIDAPIGRHSSDRTKMAVFHAVSSRRDAKTTYRTLAVSAASDASLLSCDLHTGRTHQVRVHLKTIGHPVLGDKEYATKMSKEIAERYGIRSLCLHAWRLTFRSPADQKAHSIEASHPITLRQAMDAVQLQWGEENREKSK